MKREWVHTEMKRHNSEQAGKMADGLFSHSFSPAVNIPTKADVCLFTTVYLLSQNSGRSPPLLRKNCTCLRRADPGELGKKQKNKHLTLNSPQTMSTGVCRDTVHTHTLGTLQSSTLFMASSISSLSRSALAVSAWVFVPEIMDLVACNHLSLERRNEGEFTVQLVRNALAPTHWVKLLRLGRPCSGRIVVQHEFCQLFPLF